MRPLHEWALVARAKRLPGAERARHDGRLIALARRIGLETPPGHGGDPPRVPVGVKLELTYSCNLRCAFCYTDSPRRTLERAPGLADEAWRRIGEQAIELGVIEAVVTGGEPLMRSELALELLDRFDEAGVNVHMTTNGWFVDERIANRIAALRSCRINISLDGATPELHDRARGVPGSWRRAVRAIDLLLERGVRVHVQHVVTPDNIDSVGALVEQLRTLGAPTLSLEPVVPIGAAARGQSFSVDVDGLRRFVERAGRACAEPKIRLNHNPGPRDPVSPPSFMLVRPNGAVMAGTVSPFCFGNALTDGLAECWRGIERDWNHPRVREWRDPILRGSPLSDGPVVMYRDDEVSVDQPLVAQVGSSPPELPAPAASTRAPGAGDLETARAHVRSLVLARRYRLGDVRWSHRADGSRYVRLPSGRITVLNPSAVVVMDACAPGSAGAARDALAGLYREASNERVTEDAIRAVQGLARRGVLVSV
jgi:MoaA/NifB/PqqE/SkfB family radical SAM enzyme